MTFPDTPLEIPRLVITPSTPQDHPPSPYSSTGRRPTLARSQSLLEQIDDATIPIISHQSQRRKELLAPIITIPTSGRYSPRAGRGTAASLILVALAFMLVVSSALLSPETVTGLLHSERIWMTKGRWTDDTGTRAQGAAGPWGVAEKGDSTLAKDEIDSRSTTYQYAYAGVDSFETAASYETAGPAMSHETWRSYLRRREQVTGRAGPTAHLEAWDFH